jgi:hypothetical protein
MGGRAYSKLGFGEALDQSIANLSAVPRCNTIKLQILGPNSVIESFCPTRVRNRCKLETNGRF